MSSTKLKKIKSSGAIKGGKLMLVAHPDDELIFGGQELLESGGWKVIALTNGDSLERRLEFKKVMAAVGADYEIWNCENHPHCNL